MSYAYRGDDGNWTEIGITFTIDGVQYNSDWITKETPESLAEVGVYFIEEPTEAVAGLRGERRIEDRDGKPHWVYTILPIFDPDEEKRRRAAIDAQVAAVFGGGFSPTHPAFSGERLQCRDDTDRTNWLVAEREYSKAVERDQGDVKGARFRTQSNKTITVSFADAVAILESMTRWAFAVTERGWALKDALSRGEPYDLQVGWPSFSE